MAMIDLMADEYLNSCGHDTRTKRRAVELAETLGTTKEFERAIQAIQPKIPQLEEAKVRIAISEFDQHVE